MACDIDAVISALQLGDKYRVTTPVNWKTGDDVIVHPTVTTEQAKELFKEVTVHKVRVSSRRREMIVTSVQ